MTIGAARVYVGTTPTSGVAQLALLAAEGLQQRSNVVEYGCGALHLARVLVRYLGAGRYIGIDPNRWLQDAALDAEPELRGVFAQRKVRLITRGDFIVEPRGETFADYVFAHSVLSHATKRQLGRMLFEAYQVGRPGTTLIASFRVGADTDDDEWQYPGISRFSWETIDEACTMHGWIWSPWRGETARRMYMACCPDEEHDWLVAVRT